MAYWWRSLEANQATPGILKSAPATIPLSVKMTNSTLLYNLIFNNLSFPHSPSILIRYTPNLEPRLGCFDNIHNPILVN
jgi:hypothetical protein